VGPGGVVAASELELGQPRYKHGVACSEAPATLLGLPFAAVERLEGSDPRAAVALHKLVGYFLARKNQHSKKQIDQLSGLFA